MKTNNVTSTFHRRPLFSLQHLIILLLLSLITLVEATNPDLVASFKASRGNATYHTKTISKRSNEHRKIFITNCTLTGVPTNCSCSEASLFCINLNYRSIPFYLGPEIKELDMSGNRIYYLLEQFFPKGKFLRLKSLIIKNSEVTGITVIAFQYLINLRELNLSGNKFKMIPEYTFKFNRRLQVLNLSYTSLETLEEHTFSGLKYLKELDLRNCKLVEIGEITFFDLLSLRKLWLQSNQIKTIGSDGFTNLQKLETLVLSFNKIVNFNHNVMFDLNSIKTLNLSYNDIRDIDHQFGDAPTLETLDLSHNQITEFVWDSFQNQKHLISLDLRGNPLITLPTDIFTNVPSLTTIYFDDFNMCSYAAYVHFCHPSGDGISSIHNLLDSIKLRYFVWIAAFIACIGNISIIIRRMFVVKTNEINSFFTKNLAIANFLMGIYLLIIALADVTFRNEYIRHQSFWHSSWLCHLAGVISMISSQSSVLFSALFTADHYLSVVHPFSMKRNTMQYANLGILLVWIISIFIAIIPLIVTFMFPNFYNNNGICLALQTPETFSDGWGYTFFIFGVLHSIAFAFIAYAYIKMWLRMKNPNTGFRLARQKEDRSIGKRRAFIAATNGICWLLIVVFKIAALFGISMNHDRYAWAAIVLLSVNSALNPVFHMLTSQTLKRRLNCFKSNRLSSSRHYDSYLLFQNLNYNGSTTSVNIEADQTRPLMPPINEPVAASAGKQIVKVQIHNTFSTGQTSSSIHAMKEKPKLRASDANKDAVQALMSLIEPVAANTGELLEMSEMNSHFSVKHRKRTTKNNHRNEQTSIHEMKEVPKPRASDANKDAVQALMSLNEPVAANTGELMEMAEMNSNFSVKHRKKTTNNNHRNEQTSIHEMKEVPKPRASDANNESVQALKPLINEPVAANAEEQIEMVERHNPYPAVKFRKRTTKNNHRSGQTSTGDDDHVPKIGTDSVTNERASSHEKKKKVPKRRESDA